MLENNQLTEWENHNLSKSRLTHPPITVFVLSLVKIDERESDSINAQYTGQKVDSKRLSVAAAEPLQRFRRKFRRVRVRSHWTR